MKAHMVGVGGSGMSSLALFLHESGVVVTGSDANSPKVLAQLDQRGIRIQDRRERGELLPDGLDLLIHSAAVEATDPRILRARELGVEVVKYAQVLGRIMRRFKGVAVAGSHGKTSVSALSAYLLKAAGMSPSFVFGGEAPDLGGGGGRGRSDIFIVEACEFDRSFLNLTPQIGIVTNLEPDHLDFYGSFDRLVEAFESFLRGIADRRGALIIGDEAADVLHPSRFESLDVSTFGFREDSDLVISHLISEGGAATFRLAWKGRDLGYYDLPQPGRHNVLNAAGACLLALELGASAQVLKEVLPGFRGVRRRLECRGDFGGVLLYSDYAHHPTEIKAVHDTMRGIHPSSRIVVVYQGHQKWRTGFFMETMSEALAEFDQTLILSTFSVREKDTRHLPGGEALCEGVAAKGGSSFFTGPLNEAPDAIVRRLNEGDVLVLMGAGDIDEISGIVEKKLSLRGKRSVEGEDYGGDRRIDSAPA